MTITGREIREARALLRWDRSRLARRTALPLATIERAEAAVTVARQIAIRRVLSDAGIEFSNGGQPGVRLRKANP